MRRQRGAGAGSGRHGADSTLQPQAGRTGPALSSLFSPAGEQQTAAQPTLELAVHVAEEDERDAQPLLVRHVQRLLLAGGSGRGWQRGAGGTREGGMPGYGRAVGSRAGLKEGQLQ